MSIDEEQLKVAEQVEPLGLAEDTEAQVDAATAPALRENPVVKALKTVVPPLIVFAIFLGGWYIFTYVMLSERRRFLMPPPHETLQKGFLEWDNLSEILMGLWSTTQVAWWGLGIAILFGLITATLMSQARWVENSFYPYAVVLQTIPIIAWCRSSACGSTTASALGSSSASSSACSRSSPTRCLA